jgi:hypothetical protein
VVSGTKVGLKHVVAYNEARSGVRERRHSAPVRDFCYWANVTTKQANPMTNNVASYSPGLKRNVTFAERI